MKRLIAVVITFLLVSTLPLFSLGPNDFNFAYGEWNIKGGRLYQNDLEAGMARVDIPYPQSGVVEYNFTVRYENGGVDDRHAGFGIHIFVNKPAAGKAWGNGKSYLLWLNYDENTNGITKGFSAQIYQSLGNSKMKLLADIDLNKYANILTADVLRMIIPVKIVVNGDTGEVKVYDPSNPNMAFKLNLGNKEPLEGNFISLRTNSMGISFSQ